MTLPMILDKTRPLASESATRKRLAEWLRAALNLAGFVAVSMTLLIGVAALRVFVILHHG